MSVSQASSSKALKTRLDGIKAADEELRAKEAKLEGALEESRQERREEVARAEELQSRYASLAAKSEGNDKAKKELEEVREDDARQKAKASKFEAKYASLASSFKTSSRELVQGEAKLRTEVEGERKALAEALKRGAVEGRLLAKAEEHARTWETILSAGGVVDWEAKVRVAQGLESRVWGRGCNVEESWSCGAQVGAKVRVAQGCKEPCTFRRCPCVHPRPPPALGD
jgi:chromosome segregation ATPase